MYQPQISVAPQAVNWEGCRKTCILLSQEGTTLFTSFKRVCDLTFWGSRVKLSAYLLSKFSHFCWRDIGSWFYKGAVCFAVTCYRLVSGEVLQKYLSIPCQVQKFFALLGFSLNFLKGWANLLQLNIPLSYSGGYLAFKSHRLRESSFQASFLCGSKSGSLWRCWLFYIHNK